jgi:glycosyltransferase involved in cell wall biosynthesis
MAESGSIAVVVPVYNRRLKLINTLATVVNQSKKPALLIVVDDGSSDGTGEFAESWLARKASFEWKVIRQANAGAAVARNAGFAEIADLPFVCFLDSDDLWPPEFLAASLRALEARDDAVAAVTDRVREYAGRRKPVENLSHLVPNPILWLICNDGGILSCTLIRSSAVRAAGLFVPGMIVCEDSDFLMRLFLLGGAVRSDASPVRYVKKAPLEPTEPPNLSSALPHLPYLWARHRETALRMLPKSLFEEHGALVRTAMARKWVCSAFSCRRSGQRGRVIVSLLHAFWWDYKWCRRRHLISLFCQGNEGVLASLEAKLRSEKEL